jgi:hypothetical protein
MQRASKALLVVAAASGLSIVVICVLHYNCGRHRSAQVEVERRNPALARRIGNDIAQVEEESIEAGLRKLSDVNLYYWPGPATPSAVEVGELIPLGKEIGQADLDAIMSNRRFRKVVDALGRLDNRRAAEAVSSELSAAMNQYMPLYEDELRRQAPFYKLDKMKPGPYAGPGFVTGNVREGKVVVAGARLKVLALVWISGMLGLADTAQQVEHVARAALKQRTELYEDQTLDAFFRSEMLTYASIYNRQIISSGVVGAARNSKLGVSAMKAAGVQWQERKLALFSSALTEYDLPVRSGVMQPDYSRGSLTVRFVSPLNDANFEVLLKEMRFAP